MTQTDPPIVSVIVRRYRPDNAAEFHRLSDLIHAEVRRQPGFAGLQKKLTERVGYAELVTVFAFESRETMQIWEASQTRRRLMEDLDRLSLEGASETRFSDLSVLAGPGSRLSKIETVIILIFWIALLGAVLGQVARAMLPDSFADPWRTLTLITVNVLLISYIFLPWTSRLWSRVRSRMGRK